MECDIKTEGEIMIWFISDTHFGHRSIIEMCNRPFETVEEMNRELIARWNARVKGNDTVYIMGDMFFRCENAEEILKTLKGNKHLLRGNHDGSWLTKFDASGYFESIMDLYSGSVGQRGMTLCHYPLLTYKRQAKHYMIHGHIHEDTSSDYWPLLCKRERVLNAGVDINGYQPVTFDELVENNRIYKSVHFSE